MAQIPIYIQYYDPSSTDKENKVIITKEVTHKDSPTSNERETGTNMTITQNGLSTKFKYVNSDIKFAAAQARRWAEANGLKVYLSTYIFTTDAPSDWWTFKPRESTFMSGGFYSYEPTSLSKKQGYGIIIRDISLPRVEVPEGRKVFEEQYIPF